MSEIVGAYFTVAPGGCFVGSAYYYLTEGGIGEGILNAMSFGRLNKAITLILELYIVFAVANGPCVWTDPAEDPDCADVEALNCYLIAAFFVVAKVLEELNASLGLVFEVFLAGEVAMIIQKVEQQKIYEWGEDQFNWAIGGFSFKFLYLFAAAIVACVTRCDKETFMQWMVYSCLAKVWFGLILLYSVIAWAVVTFDGISSEAGFTFLVIEYVSIAQDVIFVRAKGGFDWSLLSGIAASVAGGADGS